MSDGTVIGFGLLLAGGWLFYGVARLATARERARRAGVDLAANLAGRATLERRQREAQQRAGTILAALVALVVALVALVGLIRG